jgi:catechol 2,3-dioxygenase-like lactoylglutathione lyase family enzyme
VRLQHVSIPIPAGGEAAARAFYGDLLGLEERSVPPHLAPDGFIWYRTGAPDLELHLFIGSDPPEDARHLCFELSGLEELRARLEAAGHATRDPTPIVGRPRFFCRDPFGNLIEFARIDDPSA